MSVTMQSCKLPKGGADVPSIYIIPGGDPPSDIPSGGLPNSEAGVPTINIVPGTGLSGGFINGS